MSEAGVLLVAFIVSECQVPCITRNLSSSVREQRIAHRDGLCQAAPDDVCWQVINSGSKPREHESDKQHGAQGLLAGITSHLGRLHEDVIDIVDQEDCAAHFHETAWKA